MQTLIFALVASIQLVYGAPLLGKLLGGGGGGGVSPSSNVNPNGVLHGLNGLLGEPLCKVGVGCDNCKGLLEVLQPPLGGTVNALGLGVNCHGVLVGGGKNDEKDDEDNDDDHDDDDDDDDEESDKKIDKKKDDGQETGCDDCDCSDSVCDDCNCDECGCDDCDCDECGCD